MGSYISSRRRTSDAPEGKVVLPDGTVETFSRGMSVAELMLEHPQQCVIELRSLMADGARPAPLPADHKLDPSRVYLMLPIRQGGKAAALSAVEARRLLLRTRSILRPGSFLPPSADPSPHYSSSSSRLGAPSKKKGRRPAPGRDCGSVEEEREVNAPVFSSEVLAETSGFLNRQLSGSGRGWKPSLHTIEESALKKKVPHWLF